MMNRFQRDAARALTWKAPAPAKAARKGAGATAQAAAVPVRLLPPVPAKGPHPTRCSRTEVCRELACIREWLNIADKTKSLTSMEAAEREVRLVRYRELVRYER